METQGIFSALRKTYSGISSQMKRLEVISENIANAEALPDKQGKLYQRKVALIKGSHDAENKQFGAKMALKLNRSSNKHLGTGSKSASQGIISATPQNTYDVVEVKGEKIIHDPTHPRADENGYVKMPNVNVIEEMVDLMATSRAYEANITVLNAAKSMAKRTFQI
ncbi:MAG: flagellar basal body rod protein FlgC [Candidatus Marinimicrobia bacterium]|nr:flagellar basal body rod protein FlgC [Candidatus Neomarinimicrobiota bacterium]